MPNKTLIFIPTYNEGENIDEIVRQLLALNLEVDLLFIDDNSPDGTGKKLDLLAAQHPNLHVQHRTGKLGIGTAHIAGLRWAYQQGYQNLVTMDCDFTHSPDYIPDFIKNSTDADIVVGSRYLQEGSLSTWNKKRLFLTRLGHVLTDTFLNMPYDATGSFRLYRLDRLAPGFVDLIQSPGYSFFFESLFILNQNKYRIVEIPTHLPARTYGHSKMKLSDAVHSLKQLTTIFFERLFNPKKFQISKMQKKIESQTDIIDPQNWDEYWARSGKKSSHAIYDVIAIFYRKFIIGPSLTKFTKKYFKPEDIVLHAGCGSGQVDAEVRKYTKVIPLDISLEALTLYRQSNPDTQEVLHGSIFDIPLEDASIDGVYNLGVMEHFNAEEINLILREFRRVLKPNGVVLLFWPPKFGLSVMVLKGAHYVLNNVLKKNIQLHPHEITHISSRKHAKQILSAAGLTLVDYSFGVTDLFTHAIVVGRS
jgi:dolichol-phosphate mannosyltransferase